MKVKDLITLLKGLNQDAEVIVKSNNFELNGAKVPVKYISSSDEGHKRIETFTDAFDGGSYYKEIYSSIGGSLPVVSIS